MNTRYLLAAVAALSVTLCLPSAQAQTRFGRAIPAAPNLLNRDVVNQGGKNMGKVQDIVFDLESGRILYVVVNQKGAGAGDVVGVPPSLFALPQQAAQQQRQQQQQQQQQQDNDGLRARNTRPPLVLKANEQALTGAPKYADNERMQASYVDQVYAHFNQPRWWQGAGDSKAGSFNHVRRAIHINKLSVENPSNEKLGKVETVLFDLPAGRVSYVVLDPGNQISNKQLLVPIPPMAFTKGSESMLVLDANKDKLNNAPGINRDELNAEDIQKLSQPAFATQVYNYWGKQPWFQAENIPSPTGPDNNNNN